MSDAQSTDVIEINDTNFQESIAGAELAVVDFFASWCGPCHMFAPVFRALSKKYPQVVFFKLDGETSPEARATVKIPGLPYFAFYRKGELIGGVATSKQQKLQAMLDEHFGGAA
jgi:thiol-disulfide isomerase/thioredoxin